MTTDTTAQCRNCGNPIHRTQGGWTHIGNTTSSPQTCYRPDGRQRLAAPRS